MIGGNIINYSAADGVVTFYLEETQSKSRCYVRALMNEYEQKLIDKNAAIWWDSENVYLTIGDIPDCKFPKVGNSF